MFDVGLECGIKSVKVKVKDVDGRPLRRCHVVLAHDFSKDIARRLGTDAVRIREALCNGSVDKAVLPITGIAAIGAFSTGKDAVKVSRMVGVSATVSAPKENAEEMGPLALLEFEFSWQEDAWVFLGRHCSAVADVVLTERQLSLAGDEANN